ncbi:hypothetical protein I6A84_25400 [Frankia sp. CNm7]|uniref:Uncharacterized protein n=1 Tax=Frankia nepalensis TaxID=1836974 RepID=A0A937RMH9_9ACTN|nr:hypothetical protein [Frankia nepalensis]MBL7500766.1 hypothetical protein [Frankia nepalensis]MBL7511746.1 hypothetical protein [Frankia nepalensis]MBL7521330.1 hypothetical protein [Frankia nepalensis]MBL7633162.1 hypothetical protein [Frankia nepalensis]
MVNIRIAFLGVGCAQFESTAHARVRAASVGGGLVNDLPGTTGAPDALYGRPGAVDAATWGVLGAREVFGLASPWLGETLPGDAVLGDAMPGEGMTEPTIWRAAAGSSPIGTAGRAAAPALTTGMASVEPLADDAPFGAWSALKPATGMATRHAASPAAQAAQEKSVRQTAAVAQANPIQPYARRHASSRGPSRTEPPV